MTTDALPRPELGAFPRLVCRLRIAADLLWAAPRAEHALVAGVAATAALAAWPFAGLLYPFLAVPSALVLAALIRFHTDRLSGRVSALTAAGAEAGDLAVIQAAGPLAASGAGTFGGILAALVTLSPQHLWHAALPLTAAALATFVLRPAWVCAPALGAGAATAAVTSFAVLSSTRAHAATGLVAAAHARSAQAVAPNAAAVPGHAWLPAAVGLGVLAAAQFAVRRLHGARAHGPRPGRDPR